MLKAWLSPSGVIEVGGGIYPTISLGVAAVFGPATVSTYNSCIDILGGSAGGAASINLGSTVTDTGEGQIFYGIGSGRQFTAFKTAGAEKMRITAAGFVGIGTTNPTCPLAVNGTIEAQEIIVQSGGSNYIFSSNYRAEPLADVDRYIKAEHHLPGIPSAKEVSVQGISVGAMQSKLLAKIEELTLHQIEQEKLQADQNRRIAALEAENAELKRRLQPAVTEADSTSVPR